MTDIPGFYYDEVKKKYFKIMENKFSSTQGVYTKEKVSLEVAEKKRKEDLLKDNFSSNSKLKKINLCSLIQTRQFEIFQDHEYEINRRVYSGLKSNSVAALGYLDGITPFQAKVRLQLNKNEKSLVALCNSEVCNLIEFYDISSLKTIPNSKKFIPLHKNRRILNLSLFPYFYDYNSNLVDVSLAKDDLVIIIGNGMGIHDKSLVSINSIKSDVASNYHLNRLLTCVTSNGKERIIVGTSEGAVIINNSRSSVQHYQKFHIKSVTPLNTAEPDENVLLMGLKKGEVVSWDLRTKLQPSTVYTHKSSKHEPVSVNHLYSLSNTFSLLSSLSNGQILNIDLRNNKVITEYHEHQNDYVTTPLSVDSTQMFLCSVGIDCYTRVWDVRKGHLLSTIPPPMHTTRYCLPAVTFLPTLQTNIPGLFLLIKDTLYAYTL